MGLMVPRILRSAEVPYHTTPTIFTTNYLPTYYLVIYLGILDTLHDCNFHSQ